MIMMTMNSTRKLRFRWSACPILNAVNLDTLVSDATSTLVNKRDRNVPQVPGGFRS